LRNLSEPSWLGEPMYKQFSEAIKEMLLAKEMTERLERGETY